MAGSNQNKKGGGNLSEKSRWKPVDGRPAYHGKTIYSGLSMSVQSPADWISEEMTEKLYPEYPLPVSLADMDPGKDMTLAAAKIMHLVFATVCHAGSQRVLLPKKVAGRFIASKASAISNKDVKAAVQRLAEKKVIISACCILGAKNKPREISIFSSSKDHNRFDFEFIVSDEVWELFQKPRMWTYIGLNAIQKFKSVNGLCLYTAFTGLLEVRKRRKNLHSYSILKHHRGVDFRTGKSLYAKARKDYVANILEVPFSDLATWTGMRSTAGGTEPKRVERRIGDICDGYLKSHGHFMEVLDVFGIFPESVDEAGIKFEYFEGVRPLEYQRMSTEAKKWYVLKTDCEDLRQPPTAFQIALKVAKIDDGYQNAQRIHDEWKHYIWTQRDTYPGDKQGAKHFRDFADMLAERRTLEYPTTEEMKLAEAHWAWLEGKGEKPVEDLAATELEKLGQVAEKSFPETVEVGDLPEVVEATADEEMFIEMFGACRDPNEPERVLSTLGIGAGVGNGTLNSLVSSNGVRIEAIPFMQKSACQNRCS